jgi:hypothetical protein
MGRLKKSVFSDGCWNAVLGSSPQQEPHGLPPVREPRLSHPEEEVRLVWLSGFPHAVIHLGKKAHAKRTQGTGRMAHLKHAIAKLRAIYAPKV